MNMKRIIVSLLALVSLTAIANAQSMQFLNTSSDAEALGVAGTSAARQADAFAVQNNAAAMALAQGKGAVSAAYGKMQPKYLGTGLAGLAGYGKIGKLAFGAYGNYFMEKPYEITSPAGAVTGEFTPSEFAAGLGVAYQIIDGLSAGAAVKFANATIADGKSATAVAADVSFMYSKNGLAATLAVCNLGGGVDFGSGKNPLPSLAKAGFAYTIAGFTGSLEGDYLFAGGFMGGLGAEYCIKDMVSLRTGYHFGSGDAAIASYASFGLGFKFAGVNINAAYLLASETLGGSMMFGLGYAF